MATTTETTTTRSDGAVKTVGIIILIAGIIMIIAGGVTWIQVTSELKAAKIVVAEDAANFAGKPVAGPLTAYAQAEIIDHHALAATGAIARSTEAPSPLSANRARPRCWPSSATWRRAASMSCALPQPARAPATR